MDPDYIYYNLEIKGENQLVNTPAVFNINRTDDIVKIPSDYQIEVVDFSIPLDDIPLFLFKDNTYIFYLEYNGTTVQTYLQYVNDGGIIPHSVYNYQTFVQSMNDALLLLFNQMSVLEPTFLPPTQIFVNVSNIRRMVINIPQWYYLNNAFLYSNKILNNYLLNIPTFVYDTDLVRYNYFDFMPSHIVNGLFYYYLQGSLPSLETWNSLNRILLETNTIPVVSESIGASNNIQINLIGDYVREGNPNRNILFKSNGRGPVKLIDLSSNYPQANIDVVIRWFSNDGQTGILTIPYGKSVYIKLCFADKYTQDLENLNAFEGLNYSS